MGATTITALDYVEKGVCEYATQVFVRRDNAVSKVEKGVRDEGQEGTEYAALATHDALVKIMPAVNLVDQCKTCDGEGVKPNPDSTCAMAQLAVDQMINKVV